MSEFKRNERIGGMIQVLCDNPNKIIGLNYFSNIFGAAKSSLSEDVVIVRKTIEQMDIGTIETITGAQGGVRFIPRVGQKEEMELRQEISNMLMESNRIIAGGYLYLSDIMFNPSINNSMGRLFASKFMDRDIDYVVTVETKGIPLALMTARYLNVPLVIVRKDNRVTEGSTLSINYISGSSKNIKTMSLSRRALKENSRVVIVDDFMKAGGTVKAIVDLMMEFKCSVEGIAVAISTKEPREKLVKEYFSLITLGDINEDTREITTI
jgi:purine operon repressor